MVIKYLAGEVAEMVPLGRREIKAEIHVDDMNREEKKSYYMSQIIGMITENPHISSLKFHEIFPDLPVTTFKRYIDVLVSKGEIVVIKHKRRNKPDTYLSEEAYERVRIQLKRWETVRTIRKGF